MPSGVKHVANRPQPIRETPETLMSPWVIRQCLEPEHDVRIKQLQRDGASDERPHLFLFVVSTNPYMNDDHKSKRRHSKSDRNIAETEILRYIIAITEDDAHFTSNSELLVV